MKFFRKLIYVEAIIILTLIVVGIFIVAPQFADSKFTVINQSPEAVNITVFWRDQKFETGSVKPKARYVFTLDDESAVRFTARLKNGNLLESQPIYFTSGTSIIVTVNETDIEVAYDFKT